jgi:hypothetical protein
VYAELAGDVVLLSVLPPWGRNIWQSYELVKAIMLQTSGHFFPTRISILCIRWGTLHIYMPRNLIFVTIIGPQFKKITLCSFSFI